MKPVFLSRIADLLMEIECELTLLEQKKKLIAHIDYFSLLESVYNVDMILLIFSLRGMWLTIVSIVGLKR